MKLNHLNLTVTDVKSARAFLEKYFELKTRFTRGEGFAVLTDQDGLVLTLMQGKQVEYPRTFHIGFLQESEERVNEINQQLKNDGFEVEPPKRAHGWTFYVQAPGGFTVEVLKPGFPQG
ncbi:MAG TPA: VOC family protein [Bacillales bacterium]|nr:VOC family protein [Bacillales bacterium]